MNKALRVGLIVIALLAAAGATLAVGVAIGRNLSPFVGAWPGVTGYQSLGGVFGPAGRLGGMGPAMMQGYAAGRFPAGGSWRGGSSMGGMMGYGPAGMMGYGSGGMMGFGASGLSNADPLSLEQAETAVRAYLASLGDESLALGEIMIFDNHAYAQILEADTGFGAQEVLVDPVTLAVIPEHGPNRMWNQKYGVAAGHMGWFGASLAGAAGSPDAMAVSAAEAVEKAQAYLSDSLPGTTVDEAHPFYGYYTLDILREGEPIGMLSVNGYTGQVFVHFWHGDFVEMAEAE